MAKRKDSIYTLENLYSYCAQDVVAEAELHDKLPALSPYERNVFNLNATINERGIPVDVENIRRAIRVYEDYAPILHGKLVRLTKLPNAMSNIQFRDWLLSQGIDVPNVQRQTLEQVVTSNVRVKESIKLRLLLAKAPVKKLYKLAEAAVNGRVHDSFIYHGASTGRFASTIINVQNIARPSETMEGCESDAIDALRYNDPDYLEMMYDDPINVLSSVLRGMICAPEGKRLMVADYAAIEARVLAWVAGEESVLKVFRTHGKLYEHTAAGIFNKPLDGIEKGSHERFVGKVASLALGYQGGVKAFTRMAKQYGVDIPEREAEIIKQEYRDSHPAIVKFWNDCDSAAMQAVKARNKDGRKTREFTVGRCAFFCQGSFLYIRLPSYRKLAYYRPRVEPGEFGPQVTYMGVNSMTRQWERQKGYGGKWTENIVQAIARDILVDAMLNLERHNYTIVMTVHDEIVAEVDEDFGSLEEFERIMCWLPAWAAELPLKAEGYTSKRYRK